MVADHPAVRGAIPVSGIFDLEPIALGVLNEKLQLTADEVESLSPSRNLLDHSPPIRFAWRMKWLVFWSIVLPP